jgi:hypothetical protein
MKILLLYANPIEAKHLRFPSNPDFQAQYIGMGAKGFDDNLKECIKRDGWSIILFGCCGALKQLPLNRFYLYDRMQGNIIHTPTLVHSKKLADLYRKRFPNALLVDRETNIVADWCFKNDVPFLGVRYIVDYCEYKCKPKGINHFWRIFQHWRMQTKFNRFLILVGKYDMGEWMKGYFEKGIDVHRELAFHEECHN